MSTTTAVASVSTPNVEIESPPTETLDVASVPVLLKSEWSSGEKIWRSTFSITIASPNVVSSGTSNPARRLRSSSRMYMAYPAIHMTGSTSSAASHGGIDV